MLCRLSRLICRVLFGIDVMLCALAHALGWRAFILLVDAAFLLLRGERHHCRRCHIWES